MKNNKLEEIINKKLNSIHCKDYTPNGLQVEGRNVVRKIITGVTASQDLLNEAVRRKVDAVIVHHGFFWKGEPLVIHNMKRKRLRTLLENEINLYSWHLPLDIHPELGNNVQLASMLDINIRGKIEPMLLWGELLTPISGFNLASLIEKRLNRKPFWYGNTGSNLIKRVAWCTGKGQGFIDNAANFGVDAFITGECSEHTIYSANERKLHLYCAGHYATELGGIQALGKWLSKTNDLDILFVDIFNPI